MNEPNNGGLERLRKAVFADLEDSDKDNYPETAAEKVDYAEYITVQSMTRLAPAIKAVHREYEELCKMRDECLKRTQRLAEPENAFATQGTLIKYMLWGGRVHAPVNKHTGGFYD